MRSRAKAVEDREIGRLQKNDDMVGDMLRKSAPIAIGSLAVITAVSFGASAVIRSAKNRGEKSYSTVVTKTAEMSTVPTSIRDFAVPNLHVKTADCQSQSGRSF